MKTDKKKIEKAATEAVLKLFGAQASNIRYEPFGNDTFPDASFDLNKKKTYLEVTLSSGGILIDTNRRIKEALETNEPINRLCENLKKDIASWIATNETLILTFTKCIQKPGSLKNKLNKCLKKLYEEGKLSEDPLELEWGITASITNYYKDFDCYSPLKALIATSLESPHQVTQNNLSFQAKTTLSLCISRKVTIFKNCTYLDLKDSVWLIIPNIHPLLTAESYAEVLESFAIFDSSYFEKIFIIDVAKGWIVSEIWSR